MLEDELELKAIVRLMKWAFYVGERNEATVRHPDFDSATINELAPILGVTVTKLIDQSFHNSDMPFYKAVKYIFKHDLLSSPWGLVLLHNIYPEVELEPSVYLSPPPKFLYPTECAVLHCHEMLPQAKDSADIFKDSLPSIRCNGCGGTNKEWDKLKKKLKKAFDLLFDKANTKSLSEAFTIIWEGLKILIGYLDSELKPYVPRCALYKEGQELGVRFVKSLLMWPKRQRIILGDIHELHYFNQANRRVTSRPNLPSILFDESIHNNLNGLYISFYKESKDKNSSPVIPQSRQIGSPIRPPFETVITLSDLQEYLSYNLESIQ